MAPDPFAGPSNDLNPDRPRPEVRAGYAGECGVCGMEYDDGDLIRATADGAGWEAVDHDHDPEESAPSNTAPVEVGRTPLPAPPAGLYAVDVPTDTELRSVLGSGHPEVAAEAEHLLSLSMTERGVYLAERTDEGEGPDTRPAPAQFSCPECPKSFAPTKDKLVRTHKRLSDGERCPGSRAVPVELLPTEPPESGPVPSVAAAAPVAHRFSADPEAIAALERAAATSSQVTGIVDRLNTGQAGRVPRPDDGRTPEQQAEMDARRAAGGRIEMVAFIGAQLAPDASDAAEVMYNKVNGLDPEIDPDTGVDLDTLAAVQFPELAPEGVTAQPDTRPPSTPALANPDVDRAALYTPRPAEPEPTAENGGREPVYGRYILPNPKTGNGKTWRRATTFAGQLDDTYNLDLWQKRHLVRGAAMAAALDPQRLAKVAKWDVKQQKDALNELAEALMTESGVHLAAEQGTLVHAFTEAVDRAATAEQDADAWYAVPEHYAADVAAYRKALETYGLRVVPSLLERRTAVLEYGVAGTFDQVTEVVQLQDWSRLEGLAVGDFLVTDKKTGSNMDYGTGTHGIQLWLYAHGINTSGVWDAFTQQWTHPVTVREDVGIIVHIPLQLGECTLHALNLERGREGAVLVQQGYDRARLLRSQALRFSRPIGKVTVPKSAAAPPPQEAPVQHIPSAPPAPSQPDPMQVWRDRLATVATEQQAYAAYQAAADAGMPADLLAGYQSALQGRLTAVANAPAPATDPDPMAPWLERASRVETLDQAKAVYAEAVAAGMPDPLQKQLTDALDQRLKDLAAGPAGPDVLSAEYWTTPAMSVTSTAEAKGVYDAMIAAGVPDDVKALISQRMQDWLASQQQAAVMVAPAQTAAVVEDWEHHADRVLTQQQASELFRAAQEAPGMDSDRLNGLVARMQASLANEPPF